MAKIFIIVCWMCGIYCSMCLTKLYLLTGDKVGVVIGTFAFFFYILLLCKESR